MGVPGAADRPAHHVRPGFGSDFNYDFHVTLDPAVAPPEYDYRSMQELIDIGQPYFAGLGEKGGVSVFVRDGDTVLHTYSAYGAGPDLLVTTDHYLDLTPGGRPDVMPRLHDSY